MDNFSYIANADTAAIDELYKVYKDNPGNVDITWQKFFQGFDFFACEVLIHVCFGGETLMIPRRGQHVIAGEEFADRRVGDRFSLEAAFRHEVKKRSKGRTGDVDGTIEEVVAGDAFLGLDDVVDAVDEVFF